MWIYICPSSQTIVQDFVHGVLVDAPIYRENDGGCGRFIRQHLNST